MVAFFCDEQLSENDFEVILVNFCCYDYGANASEAVQKISTWDTGVVCQLMETANFIATSLKKHIHQFIAYLLEPGFCFFPDINKKE